jgi:hypothetical protein
MIVERSSLTMIRWTPVCGPEPVRNEVRGEPEGWSIVNATVVGFPGETRRPGWKFASLYVFAAPTVILFELEDAEQPAASETSRRSAARRRIAAV